MHLLFEVLKDLGVVADQLRVRFDDSELFEIHHFDMPSMRKEETYDWRLPCFIDRPNSTITYSRFDDIDRWALG